MTILETILSTKQKEVASLKKYEYGHFEKSPFFEKKVISLKNEVVKKEAIYLITEFKRKSPSKGNINLTADINTITATYQNAGSSAISILTDTQFFGGSNEDITNVREKISVPILRKEFIIDEVQILEAKALGADMVLLIAACLQPNQVKELATFAKQLGLEVLLELHTQYELKHICNEVDFVGVNNRNLKDFSVSLDHSIVLRNEIGSDFITIAESGIKSADDVSLLFNQGFDAFLIGEYLMQQNDIDAAIRNLKSIVSSTKHTVK
jgi:indole-3-glycerol phosphate synthase